MQVLCVGDSAFHHPEDEQTRAEDSERVGWGKRKAGEAKQQKGREKIFLTAKTLVHVGFCSNHTALICVFCYSDLWDCLFFTVTLGRAYIASFVCAVQTFSIWNVNIGCCSNNVGVGPKPTHFLIQQLVRIDQTDNWKFGFWLVTMSSHSIELVPETTYAVEEGLLHLLIYLFYILPRVPDTKKLLSFRRKQISYT